MKVLLVVAHPDDEVFGPGATVHRWAREGQEVHALIFGEGPAARAVVYLDMRRIREAEERLGIEDFTWLRFQDQRFDALPLLTLTQRIEQECESARPDLLLTHDASDLNLDHALVHRAVLTACRPTGKRAPDIWCFSVGANSEWSGQGFQPNVFVTVSEEDLQAKLAAAEAYGELREPPHPLSAEALRASAIRWGSIAGVPLAEAFRIIREVR